MKYLNLRVVVSDGRTGALVVVCLILITGGTSGGGLESDISFESGFLLASGRSRTICCLNIVLSSIGSPFGVVSSILCGLKRVQ